MDMQKPYDGQALVSALKGKGIEEAEKVAKEVVVTLADWLRSSMALSKDGIVGHLDDLAIPVVNSFERMALAKLDALAAEVAQPVGPLEPAPAADPVPAPAPVDPAPASDPAPSA